MIGGATYEEARTVTLFNQDPAAVMDGPGIQPGSIRVILGGTCIHNSSSYVSLLFHESRAESPVSRYIELIRAAAPSFPASVYDPPPESSSNAPALNLNLGGVNVTLGGPAGTGVYRTSNEGLNVQADGLRDGVLNLIGKVKQGVDRIGIQ